MKGFRNGMSVGQGVATQKSRSIHLPDLAKLASEGSPPSFLEFFALGHGLNAAA